MNAHNGFTISSLSIDKLSSILNGICSKDQIQEYQENKHKKLEYGADFIYINDTKNNKIYVIKGIDLSKFDEVKKILNDEDFDIFCFSKTRTGTSYNTFKPTVGGIVLEMKPKVLDILDFNKK
ncbi:hypothetical protein EOM39_01505 [Candidatus Gracilibacteria bacterium]|nr:hypothetical protein [Candidatus Gracilibacteria bacterium]